MGSIASKLSFTGQVIKSVGAYMIFGWSKDAYIGDSDQRTASSNTAPTFLDKESLGIALSKVFEGKLDSLSNDALAKICRQLEYFHDHEKASESELIQLAEFLVDQSTWYLPLVPSSEKESAVTTELEKAKVPKVRFGKTELQMPLITCGGMRLQNSWLPDNIPVLAPSRDYVLQSPPQENIKNCIKHCLSLGINHFETARYSNINTFALLASFI